MQSYQSTIMSRIRFEGVGLHSGKKAIVDLIPQSENAGVTISFCNPSGLILKTISAVSENIFSTELCTVMGDQATHVKTVEHLLSAIYGLEIDNVRIIVYGNEIPVLDGSSRPFINEILKVGIRRQDSARVYKFIKKRLEFAFENSLLIAEPSPCLNILCSVDYKDNFIGKQNFHYVAHRNQFKEIAGARTFCYKKDIDFMHSKGLALGGSLDNAIVVDDDKVLNPDGLRYKDEFVRHKVLDFIGDLSLFGAPLLGTFTINKPGHKFNAAFTQWLRKNADTYLGTLSRPLSSLENIQDQHKEDSAVLQNLSAQFSF